MPATKPPTHRVQRHVTVWQRRQRRQTVTDADSFMPARKPPHCWSRRSTVTCGVLHHINQHTVHSRLATLVVAFDHDFLVRNSFLTWYPGPGSPITLLIISSDSESASASQSLFLPLYLSAACSSLVATYICYHYRGLLAHLLRAACQYSSYQSTHVSQLSTFFFD